MAKRAGYLSPPRVMLLRLRPLIKWTSAPTQCAGERRICAGCKSSLRPSVTWSDLNGLESRGVSIARRMAALVVLAAQRR